MKKLVLINFVFFSLSFAFAQEVPLYINTYNNIYLQNPSMAGYDGHGIIYLTAHKQIIAGRDDAPQYGTLSYHAPIGKTRSAIGFVANYFKRSFLNTTGATATFAHRIDFDANQHVRFGLSIGISSNNIDITILDNVKDQVFYNQIVKKTVVNGQFGISYQLKKFNLGASFPRLFNNYTTDSLIIKGFYPLKSFILFTTYKFNISSDITFKPLLYYRSSQFNSSQYEVNGIINYKEQIWAGATYRENYGTAIMIGVRAKNLSIGYAYKIPNASQYNYANPAHEIQLALHFKESIKKLDLVDSEQQRTDSLTVKNLPEPDKYEPDVRVATKEGDHPLELPVNHYIVVGSFKYEANAKKLITQLKSNKLEGKLGYNASNQKYYIYIFNTKDYDKAVEYFNVLRKKPGFEDTWILKIIEE